MFNKILLASITLDKKKHRYCTVECIPNVKLLDKEEQQELGKHLEIVCSLLRKAYIKAMRG